MTRLISITALLLFIVTPAFAHRGHHHARRGHHRSILARVSSHGSRHHADHDEKNAVGDRPRHHYNRRHDDVAVKERGGVSDNSGDRPRKIEGLLELAGKVFDFVSGGAGWSIPFGDWEITGSDGVGSWGERHGAIGIAGGEIYDPVLHRKREGIELHAGRYATEGCVAIAPKQWPDFKHRLLAMLDHGKVYLHVGKDGAAIVQTNVTVPVTWGILC